MVRSKASNPLFPAAPVAGVGALRVLQLYAVFTLSPERFCSISVGQYMRRFGGKYAPWPVPTFNVNMGSPKAVIGSAASLCIIYHHANAIVGYLDDFHYASHQPITTKFPT